MPFGGPPRPSSGSRPQWCSCDGRVDPVIVLMSCLPLPRCPLMSPSTWAPGTPPSGARARTAPGQAFRRRPSHRHQPRDIRAARQLLTTTLSTVSRRAATTHPPERPRSFTQLVRGHAAAPLPEVERSRARPHAAAPVHPRHRPHRGAVRPPSLSALPQRRLTPRARARLLRSGDCPPGPAHSP